MFAGSGHHCPALVLLACVWLHRPLGASTRCHFWVELASTHLLVTRLILVLAACRPVADCSMTPFDFQPRTRIVYGAGKVASLGELASELGARRALVVSDPGVIAAGHTAKGVAALERAG